MVMLDRDGTLTEENGRDITKPEDLRLIPGAGEAVALLNRAGIPAVLVTNQEVVGRGQITDEQLERIHQKLRADLAKLGAKLDGMFICTDDPDKPGPCHKPASGLLVDALQTFQAQAHEAPMIGDEESDLKAAVGAGCPGILVCTGKGAETLRKLPPEARPIATYKDLYEAVASLLGEAALPPKRARAGG